MEFIASASAEFSASHVVKGHPRCGRIHGHRWRITVTIKAGQDPKSGELDRLPELAIAVESLAAEAHREHINDMFPGTHPTMAGLCLTIKERLALEFPNIESVTVEADEGRSTLRA